MKTKDWSLRLTLEASGCGYDVKDQSQNAEAHTNRRDIVVAILCGHTLAAHTLAQRFPLIRNTLLCWRTSQLGL
jgi:hypothetical protein